MSCDPPKVHRALFIAKAPSDKRSNESTHKREVFVQVNGYKSHLIIPFVTMIRGKREESVTINTLYAPTRRYPVCFSLLLYYDDTLPMLD